MPGGRERYLSCQPTGSNLLYHRDLVDQPRTIEHCNYRPMPTVNHVRCACCDSYRLLIQPLTLIVISDPMIQSRFLDWPEVNIRGFQAEFLQKWPNVGQNRKTQTQVVGRGVPLATREGRITKLNDS